MPNHEPNKITIVPFNLEEKWRFRYEGEELFIPYHYFHKVDPQHLSYALANQVNLSKKQIDELFESLKTIAKEGGPKKYSPGRIVLCCYSRENYGGDYENQNEFRKEVIFANVRELLAKFFLLVHYNYAEPGFNWRDYCIGVTSYSVGTHMPMLDYDGRNIKRLVRKDIKVLQEKFGLGPAQIYRTRRGIHIYFPTDMVDWNIYKNILETSNCCEGFRKATLNRRAATLRVSAKYSDFDISKLEKIYPKEMKEPRRAHTRGIVADQIIALGEQCGTHIASMYPQWCVYNEDTKAWKPTPKKKAKTKKPNPVVKKHTFDHLPTGWQVASVGFPTTASSIAINYACSTTTGTSNNSG